MSRRQSVSATVFRGVWCVFVLRLFRKELCQITLDEHGRLISINNNASSSLTPGSSNQGKKKRTPTKTNFNLPSLGDVGVLLRSVCHVCLKVFGTAYHLTRHIESCHNGDIRPFSCTACNKMFKRKDHLTKHVKSHCPALKAEQQSSHSKSPQAEEQTDPKLRPGDSTPKLEEPAIPQIIMETPDQQLNHQSSSEMDSGMLSDGSGNSSDCHHTILQNLQVEMDVGQHDDDSIPSTNNQVMSAATSSGGAEMHDDHTMGGVLIGGDLMKHSTSVADTSATEFSFAVIDSLIQGGVNVVVVNEEISNFLQQTSSSHLTTTFLCAQCQKEFPQRDQLIAHLQEHPTDSMMHGHHHHQQIADISFPDF